MALEDAQTGSYEGLTKKNENFDALAKARLAYSRCFQKKPDVSDEVVVPYSLHSFRALLLLVVASLAWPWPIVPTSSDLSAQETHGAAPHSRSLAGKPVKQTTADQGGAALAIDEADEGNEPDFDACLFAVGVSPASLAVFDIPVETVAGTLLPAWVVTDRYLVLERIRC